MDPTPATLEATAERLRGLSLEHEVAKTAAAFTPEVLAAEEHADAVGRDADLAIAEIDQAFVHAFAPSYLREKLSLQPVVDAAHEVVAGIRAALEPLPEVAFAKVQPPAIAPQRHTGRGR